MSMFDANLYFRFLYAKMTSVLVVVACFILSACNDNSGKDIHNYYVNPDSISAERTYFYSSVDPGNPQKQIWKLKSERSGNSIFVSGSYIDENGLVYQTTREEYLNDGSVMRELNVIQYDSTRQAHKISVKIEQNNVFPFLVKNIPSGVFVYVVSWKDPLDTAMNIRLIRNRQIGAETTYKWQNNTMSAIVVNTKDLIETEKDGFQEIKYKGSEIYARNIGLVYFKKDFGKWTEEFKLDSIR